MNCERYTGSILQTGGKGGHIVSSKLEEPLDFGQPLVHRCDITVFQIWPWRDTAPEFEHSHHQQYVHM